MAKLTSSFKEYTMVYISYGKHTKEIVTTYLGRYDSCSSAVEALERSYNVLLHELGSYVEKCSLDLYNLKYTVETQNSIHQVDII